MLQLALPSFMPATRSLGRGRWQLLEPWQFELNAETYTIPRLFITDLFSVPWPLTVLLPKDLDDNRPALPHDYIFATGGLRQTANDSPLVTLATANEVIALAMKMCRFKSSTQWAVNTGLRIGSRPVWNRLLAEGWSIKNPLLA